MRKASDEHRRRLEYLGAERDKRAAALAGHLRVAPDPADLVEVARHREQAERLGVALSDAETGIAKVSADLEAACQAEAAADLERRRAEQERASDKLAARLRREYPAAVAALVGLLDAAKADARACETLADELRDAGLPSGFHDAEERARREFRLADRWTYLSFGEALIPSLEGPAAWGQRR